MGRCIPALSGFRPVFHASDGLVRPRRLFYICSPILSEIEPARPTGQGRVCAVMQVIDLEELKSRGVLWQGQRGTLAPERVLATGWGVLDELLGGGWPRAALIEVLSEAHQGLALWLPLLARLSADPRWLVWVAPPYLPYAPALAARGVRVERVLLVRDVASPQALWAVEQALKSVTYKGQPLTVGGE